MNDQNAISYQNLTTANGEVVFFRSTENASARDRVIWNAFRFGSRQAFDFIFKQHASNLFAYGSRFTKDHNLVLDCIQDLFVEIWNNRRGLGETSSIKFYLLKSLRHRIARTIQGAKRMELAAEGAGYLEERFYFSAEHFLVMQESEQFNKANLRRAIEGLTRRQRESVYLKYFQGLDNESIGSVMGLSEGSVSTLVSQAIRALRSAIA